MDKLTELKSKIEEFQAKSAFASDMKSFMAIVLKVIKDTKDNVKDISDENQAKLDKVLAYLEAEHANLLENVDTQIQNVTQETTKLTNNVLEDNKSIKKDVSVVKDTLTTLKSLIDDISFDAEFENLGNKITELEKKIPKIEEETGETIVDKINSLNTNPDNQIDAKHIKNLPITNTKGGGGVRFLQYLTDVNISSPTDNQVLTYDGTTKTWKNETGGGGGGGTWGSITGTLSNQTDLQTALDAKLDGNGTATYVPFYADTNTLESDSHFYYNKTTDVLHVHGLAGDATDGLLIESENGTDIAIMGAANTANVTWYGNHNFNTVTASRVAQFGASKTLESSSVTNTELGYLSGVTSAIQTQLDSKVDENIPITGATKTKITYDSKGLVTAGADATTTDIAEGTNLYFTDERAQDAVGGMVANSTFVSLAYSDLTPSITASLSATGTPSSSTYLRGDNTWATIGGGGDVTKVGTPVNNQIGVWTGDGTIEGTSGLTYDGSNLLLTGDLGSTGSRITKGWFTDLQVTNAISGSITGNAATVTGFAAGAGTLTGPASSGVAVTLGNTETITGVKTMSGLNVITHSSTGLIVRNPANTFSYTITGAAIAAARTLNLPLITGTDTLVSLGLAQTFTGAITFNNASVLAGASTMSVFNTTATTLNFGGAATTLTIGGTPTTAITHNYSTNATANATTKTINFGTGGAAGSTTNINIGSSNGGTLTINSPTTAHGTGSITLTGSIATTGARVTKGWFTDIESTNMPTVGGTSLSSTFAAIAGSTGQVFSVSSLEVGNTDTTISRSSAGIIAVEGVAVPTISSTDTLSNKTLTAPKFADLGFIADANGNELLILDTVTSAVNEITFANAATGNNPSFTASGGDTNIGFNFTTKGTGTFNLRGNSTQPAELRLYEDTDLGTNYTAFKVGSQSADISYVLPTAQGGASTYLSNDGSGNLSWGTPSGGSSTAVDSTQSVYNNYELEFSGSGATPTGNTWDGDGTLGAGTSWNGKLIRITFGTASNRAQFLPGNIGSSSAFFQFGNGKDIIISFNAKFSSVSGQVGIGVIDNTSALSDVTQSSGKLMFTYNGTTLNAVNGEATTNTTTNVSSGITRTNWNNYRIHYRYGTDVRFYINNTLVATHTTNLPTSSNNGRFGFGGATNNNTAELANVVISVEQ